MITVAIPVKNGGALLERTLQAVLAQRPPDRCGPIEVLVCDSGSSDSSVALARRYGASVVEIAAQEFSHGGTRNLLMERAQGSHVAFLTQDAEPASPDWLAELYAGCALADDVALCFGPYRPRPGASLSVARELTAWFEGFAPDGVAVVDRLASEERDLPAIALLGRRGFFTDANGMVLRAAWERVPFREIAYAEDHALAHDMLRAGYAKVFAPRAAVLHSHDYRTVEQLRRSFDEARALGEVYGYVEPGGVRRNVLRVWGNVGADERFARAAGPAQQRSPRRRARRLAAATAHHTAVLAGALLGSRAERLPARLRQGLSLEQRG